MLDVLVFMLNQIMNEKCWLINFGVLLYFLLVTKK